MKSLTGFLTVVLLGASAADARPTSQALDAVEKLQERLRFLVRRWEELKP